MPSEERGHDLLALYLNERLDEADMRRFREHLESCGDCRAEKEFLEDVREQARRHGDELFEDHPPPDRLVACLSGTLPAAEVSKVRRHLELCLTCSAEARWITSEGVAVAAPVAPGRAARTGWHGAWVAGLAAAVVLAVALPAVLGKREQPSFPHSQFVGQRELAEKGPVITLARGASSWSAHFPIDAEVSDFPCAVEVVDSGGHSLARTTVSGPDALVGGLYLLFSCPRSVCPLGSYTLRIEAAGGRLLETIPFEVVQAP